jgi:hypothetical protein
MGAVVVFALPSFIAARSWVDGYCSRAPPMVMAEPLVELSKVQQTMVVASRAEMNLSPNATGFEPWPIDVKCHDFKQKAHRRKRRRV